MRVGLAQINTTVGAFRRNRDYILSEYQRLCREGAELVITPELALSGYPPQDLVFKSRFVPTGLEVLSELEQALGEVPLLVGFIDRNTTGFGPPFHNAAALLRKGQERVVVHKTRLPTYDVFDESRYFEPGHCWEPVTINGRRWGITICEDIWANDYLDQHRYKNDPLAALAAAGVEGILNLSASPYHYGKPSLRQSMLQTQARRAGVPIVYCNAVGGNDQLVFDGNSTAMNSDGEILGRLQSFQSDRAVIDLNETGRITPWLDECEEVYEALVLGVRDYMAKCGFRQAVLGLSGGIDSALTACVAVSALGAENVTGVAMPGPYSSKGSIDDARLLSKNLGIRFLMIPIRNTYNLVYHELSSFFGDRPADATEENLQSRLRGLTLMALSNKFGTLLLTTGNKSELAVGYCTLYGDMCGGLAVISDLPKTRVYSVSRWINRQKEIIPHATIEKQPSAELRPDQKDEDSLPPYDVLDAILEAYVEHGKSLSEICGSGYQEEIVRWVIRKVDLNEYKRQQAAPGIRVTSKAFGFGRRIPIAQGFVE